MTQAAVSYQIKLLEDRVGEPLFLRGARGVTLTETGRQLAPVDHRGVRAAPRQRSRNCARRREASSSITALTTFATNWLVPRLGGFQLRIPGSRCGSTPRNRWSISRARISTSAFAAASGSWPGLVAHGLFPAAFTPMLSPRLLETVWAARRARPIS